MRLLKTKKELDQVMWMPDNFEGTYNYYGEFQFITPSCSIGLLEVELINQIATAKWGWHFIPKKGKDGKFTEYYDSENDEWYKNQRCIISFDDKDDLTQAVLMIGDRL